ncbi:MAG: flagellar hook capping FlgD N-terminal domain-containing protein [Deltaproteobacteria bacterium]|nr:flagellar hook capping FlgD N-terminal domain-containing protein [Deltaproteobacteria bacterium]
MDIKGLGLATSASQTQSGTGQILDKDSFMKLFVAQMQHQDPLKPMEAYEISAQLAQFSSLEQLYNLNENMNNMIAYQTSQNNLQLLSLINKNVEVVTDKLTLQGGKATEARYELGEEATSCAIKIYGEDGTCVRSLNLGSRDAGSYTLDWDGRDQRGAILPDGRYYFDVVAKDAAGQEVPVNTSICGRITGLDFEGGITMLVLEDGSRIGVADVVRVIDIANSNAQEETTT